MTIGQMLLAQKAASREINQGVDFSFILDDFLSYWFPDLHALTVFEEWLEAEVEAIQCTAKMGN